MSIFFISLVLRERKVAFVQAATNPTAVDDPRELYVQHYFLSKRQQYRIAYSSSKLCRIPPLFFKVMS